MDLKAGLLIFTVGILMMLIAWLIYRRATASLRLVKQEDLVSYYLELAIKLIPIPFWTALIGMVLSIIGIIIMLINIPWVA